MNRTALFEKIAQDYLHIETLKTRNCDRLDFHDIGVGCVADALHVAFDEGVKFQIQEQRIKETVSKVENVIWNTVADSFPEIKTGDYPPDMTCELQRQLYHYIKLWVEYNNSVT